MGWGCRCRELVDFENPGWSCQFQISPRRMSAHFDVKPGISLIVSRRCYPLSTRQ